MGNEEVIAVLGNLPPPVLEPPDNDWDLDPPTRRAAVLVPIVAHPEGLTVLFCLRSKHLRRHAGEVAFPGGRIEPGEDEISAALREAEEEIALDPATVTVQGRLDTHRAGSGFQIAPIVGLVRPPLVLQPDGIEVDDAFEVPLGYLIDPAHHRRESIFWRGRDRWYSVWEFGDRYIWGATATVLLNLVEVLRGER